MRGPRTARDDPGVKEYMIRIIPPDEAKKRARDLVAAWKRRKVLRAAKDIVGPEDIKPPESKAHPTEQDQEALNYQLLLSVDDGDLEGTRKLLDNGADVNARDCFGHTTLMIAAKHCEIGIVNLLLDRGASVDARDAGGNTALMLSSDEGRTEIVMLLLERGADINAKPDDGMSALMGAAHCGESEMVEFLLRNGADKNATDIHGWNALYWASPNNGVAALLERYGAKE